MGSAVCGSHSYPPADCRDLHTSLLDVPLGSDPVSPAASSSSLTGVKSPSQPASRLPEPTHYSDNPYTPYSDDPEADEPSSHELLQSQRHMMDEQDMRLDQLAHSIGRQRDLSVQINDELDVHHGLLEEMDEDLDRTGNRMSQARRSLERVAKAAKENSALCLSVTSSRAWCTDWTQARQSRLV